MLLLEGIRQHPGRLLERLRKQLVQVDMITQTDREQKMELILQHRSKLPAKLRGAITELSEIESRPLFFWSGVYEAARAFFHGPHFRIVPTKKSPPSGSLSEAEIKIEIESPPADEHAAAGTSLGQTNTLLESEYRQFTVNHRFSKSNVSIYNP